MTGVTETLEEGVPLPEVGTSALLAITGDGFAVQTQLVGV
jgi:hypothetical protein